MLPQAFLNQIKEHAESCYPEECCGVVTASRSRPDLFLRLLPMRNAQNDFHRLDPKAYPRTAENAYVLDPRHLLRLEKELTEKPDEFVCIIYHSHPDGEAFFSEEDQRLAVCGGEPVYPGVIYLVCPLNQGVAGDVVYFTWNEARKKYMQISG